MVDFVRVDELIWKGSKINKCLKSIIDLIVLLSINMNPKRKSSDKLKRRSNGKRKSGKNLVIIDKIPNPKSLL